MPLIKIYQIQEIDLLGNSGYNGKNCNYFIIGEMLCYTKKKMQKL